MDLPTAIDKRNMLYAPDPRRPFDPIALGDAFAEKGRLPEALDFYERITDTKTRDERIGRIKSAAKSAGSAFLLNRIAAKGFVPVSKDDWRETAVAAKGKGQLRFALRAAIQAGEEALMAELRAALGDAVPAALAAQAESPEQAKAGATTPGHKVEAVAATGAAHSHEPARPAAALPQNGGEAKPQNGGEAKPPQQA
jgi:hypothetical protein